MLVVNTFFSEKYTRVFVLICLSKYLFMCYYSKRSMGWHERKESTFSKVFYVNLHYTRYIVIIWILVPSHLLFAEGHSVLYLIQI